MTRTNLLLALGVVASAIGLVTSQYESRRLFTELDKAKVEERRLASILELLEVEKRAQATPARVDYIAREKLQMHPVLPAITAYVGYTETAAPGTSTDTSAGTNAVTTVGTNASVLKNTAALAVPEVRP
ncbi:MAG: cell division protein FtsL [Rhodoferax sp.]|nr:cell division protein FtsL [Rhodoferax sp.]